MSSDPYSIWQRVDQLYLEVNRFIMGRLWAAGFDDLRLAHSRVFECLGEEGATVTALAQRAQMTKQSMGELVVDLERLGYLERRVDPNDRRAKLVSLTPTGANVVQAAFGALDALRTITEQAVGVDQLQQVQEVLDRLVPVVRDASGTTTADR